MTHEDDRLPDAVRSAVQSYHVPAEPSRAELDAMWSAIERDAFPARFASPSAERMRRGARADPGRAWFSGRNLIPLAAVLLLGVAIGRFALPRKAVRPEQVAVRRAATDSLAVPDIYQSTASRYLGQTTALLAALPGAVADGRGTDQFHDRAHDLLLTTRLLLDTPAAADPRFHDLLEDLELVLAQVVRLQPDQSREELDLIRQAIEQRDVLPRLRNAVADISADD